MLANFLFLPVCLAIKDLRGYKTAMITPLRKVEPISIRLAQNQDEIRAAQELRYKVFYEEYGAKADPETMRLKRDADPYDVVADHLIVVDNTASGPTPKIVGTYRVIQQSGADKIGGFYSSAEYDITPLHNCGMNMLELGRSCVLPEYRTRSVLQLLWQGIATYVLENKIEILFGCASFHGTDVEAISRQLAYLHHYHLAPPALRPVARDERYIEMNLHEKEPLSPREMINTLPPLIKGYLRAGCMVGEGAVIDEQFNTIDVCIVLQTDLMASQYRKHYKLPLPDELSGNTDDDVQSLFSRKKKD